MIDGAFEIFPSDSTTGSPLSFLLFYLPLLFFIFYGQKIQMWMVLNEVGRALNRLKVMKERARNEAIDHIKKVGRPDFDPTPVIDRFLEYFTIMPVSMDPSGIMKKLEHLILVRDERIESEVGMLAKDAGEVERSAMENLIEVATALNFIYKIVRHFYLLGKRTTSLYILIQLQMIMPMILQEAEALMNAIEAVKNLQPLGDGIGPLVVGRFMLGKEKRVVAKDTVMSESEINGRRVIFLKAKGPGGNVGQPGRAIERLIDEMKAKIDAIIMIDAALKLEGEKSGDVAEGIGAAIGGIGVERYKIEEVATKYQIPLYAIVIKESIGEAISVMRKEIADAVERVVSAVHRLIEERTEMGDTVMVVGVGNTLGIAQ